MSKLMQILSDMADLKGKTLFYPSCGSFNIFPEMFQLKYDFFVCSDHVDIGRSKYLSKFSIDELEHYLENVDTAIAEYPPLKLDKMMIFWDHFRARLPISKYEIPEPGCIGSEVPNYIESENGLKILEIEKDFIFFQVMGKKALLVFLDNQITIKLLKSAKITLSCFVAVADGSREKEDREVYNYHSVTSGYWHNDIISLKDPEGLCFITGYFGGTLPSGHNIVYVHYRDWMKENNLYRNPFPQPSNYSDNQVFQDSYLEYEFPENNEAVSYDELCRIQPKVFSSSLRSIKRQSKPIHIDLVSEAMKEKYDPWNGFYEDDDTGSGEEPHDTHIAYIDAIDRQ